MKAFLFPVYACFPGGTAPVPTTLALAVSESAAKWERIAEALDAGVPNSRFWRDLYNPVETCALCAYHFSKKTRRFRCSRCPCKSESLCGENGAGGAMSAWLLEVNEVRCDVKRAARLARETAEEIQRLGEGKG